MDPHVIPKRKLLQKFHSIVFAKSHSASTRIKVMKLWYN